MTTTTITNTITTNYQTITRSKFTETFGDNEDVYYAWVSDNQCYYNPSWKFEPSQTLTGVRLFTKNNFDQLPELVKTNDSVYMVSLADDATVMHTRTSYAMHSMRHCGEKCRHHTIDTDEFVVSECIIIKILETNNLLLELSDSRITDIIVSNPWMIRFARNAPEEIHKIADQIHERNTLWIRQCEEECARGGDIDEYGDYEEESARYGDIDDCEDCDDQTEFESDCEDNY